MNLNNSLEGRPLLQKILKGIKELPLSQVGELSPKQIESIFNIFVPVVEWSVPFRAEVYQSSEAMRNNVEKVLTLDQIQMFSPEEIQKYISRLPLAWLKKLTSEQKQAVLQKGIDKLSLVEIGALGG